VEHVTIDYIILANHAEAVNGMLNLLGGGWTDLNRPIPADGSIPLSHFGIAVSVCIPWTETNRPHRFGLRIVDEDESATLVQVETQFTTGRPPTISEGSEQHWVVALNADVMFPKTGGYVAITEVDNGAHQRRWPFRVHDIMVPMQFQR
jgi:hypothetical protein